MKKIFIAAVIAAFSVVLGISRAEAQVAFGIHGPGISVMAGPGWYAPPPPPPPGMYYRGYGHRRCYAPRQVFVPGHWAIGRRGFQRWIPAHWEWE